MPDWRSIRPHLGAIPPVVLALALLATFGSWYAVDRSLAARADLRFDEAVQAATESVLDRLRAYELMLRGGSGLFFASEEVSRDEFRTYVGILELESTYPGVQGFGYIRVVPGSALAAHEASVRADVPGYGLHPAGDRATFAPVVYLEPGDAQNLRVLGYDMMSEPVRREAMERARDAGVAAVSGKVVLLQEFTDEQRTGFMMFLPVYGDGRDPGDVASRRAALRGFVYAPFRAADLMRETVHPESALVRFALYDGTTPSAEALLYDGIAGGAPADGRTRTVALKAGGRDWTLTFSEAPRFAAATRSSEAEVVAGAGTIVSLIVFALTMLMSRMVSERQRAAEALHASEHRFQQAQKMESIGQLTGGIAHDFNNMLTVVMGNAEHLVDATKDNAKLNEASQLILGAAERGAELTSRLLAFARRQPLDPAPTDVGKLVAGMDALLRRTIGAQIGIEIVRGGGLWDALVDAPQLESAVLNLGINARDAMPEGGRLTIEVANVHLDHAYAGEHVEVAPGQYVMVAVSDTGTGVAADVVDRAFEPFYTTKPVGKGSGLGLSMVYGFVKQSKGHIKIYSEPGQGTTVKLYLPRALDGARVERSAAAREMPRGTEKILVVEDDDLVRGHVAAQLGTLGYTVVAAVNGREALEALRRDDAVQLLFTDVVMPGGMNGRELADEARKLRPDLPVLFTSGYTENAVVHHGRLDPGVHLLTKPYRQHELAAKVRAVLDERRAT